MERRAEVNAALWRSAAESTPAHDKEYKRKEKKQGGRAARRWR